MSKDKISSQEIIDLVATKASVSKRAAEEFLKAMIATIEEALLSGELVKIKNFGTFKLQWNEPRKSVNVNTGEEIIIDGYYKVTFSPETSLKDLVNEPFAHLEAVQLDGENNLNVSEQQELEALDPLRIFTEQATEIKDILSEIQALSSNVTPHETENPILNEVEVIPDETKTKEKEVILDEITIEEKEHFLPIETTQEFIKKEEIAIQSVVHEVDVEPLQQEVKKPKSKHKARLFVLLIILLAGGVATGLYFSSSTVKELTDSTFIPLKMKILKVSEKISVTDMVNTISGWISPETQKPPLTVTIVIPKDTTAIDTVVNQQPIDSLQLLFDSPRVYSGYLGSERINHGSRLTLFAKRYYGNKLFWVYIYEANKDRIKNPNQIPEGTLIKIPKLDKRLIDSNNSRCIQKAIELHDIYVK